VGKGGKGRRKKENGMEGKEGKGMEEKEREGREEKGKGKEKVLTVMKISYFRTWSNQNLESKRQSVESKMEK